MLAVGDTIRLGQKYGALLAVPQRTVWPSAIVGHVGARLGLTQSTLEPRRGLEETCVSHWLDIQVIAKWTAVVHPVIYYPFIVLSIMILARSLLFDNWYTPPPLLVVLCISALYAVACAFMLRQVAERARGSALERFTQLLIRVRGDPDLEMLSGKIEIMIEEIKSLREGAFARFTEQPVVRALLLPIGSGGALALVHYFGWGPW